MPEILRSLGFSPIIDQKRFEYDDDDGNIQLESGWDVPKGGEDWASILKISNHHKVGNYLDLFEEIGSFSIDIILENIQFFSQIFKKRTLLNTRLYQSTFQ